MVRCISCPVMLAVILAIGTMTMSSCSEVAESAKNGTSSQAATSPQPATDLASPEAAVAGTYDLDREAIRAALRQDMEATDDDAERISFAMMINAVDTFTISVTLNEDGTASGTSTLGDDTQIGRGTWTLDGEAIAIALGVEGEAPERMTGTVRDGRMELVEPGAEDASLTLVFNKRERKNE